MRYQGTFTKPIAVKVGKGAIIILWVVLGALMVGLCLELFLKKNWDTFGIAAESKRPNFEYLRNAYLPFTVQHINPHYLFFFPFNLEERQGINNEVVSVDENGFRGLGPKHAGDRKLAFLLGGSAAFGHYASSDSTTISGFLNQIQKEYFFINAGVPSWNSTQELYRVVYQILEYEPALIVAYDGANDVAIMLDYHEKGFSFPPGTPESFEKLHALVDNIRGVPSTSKSWNKKFFPRTTRWFRKSFSLSSQNDSQPEPLSPERLQHHVKKYLYNLKLMNSLSTASGAQFVAIFQPIKELHQNIVAENNENGISQFSDLVQDFHKRVFKEHDGSFKFFDFSNIFDAHYPEVPSYDKEGTADISHETIFVDDVHLFDGGYRIIAKEIYARIHGKS